MTGGRVTKLGGATLRFGFWWKGSEMRHILTAFAALVIGMSGASAADNTDVSVILPAGTTTFFDHQVVLRERTRRTGPPPPNQTQYNVRWETVEAFNFGIAPPFNGFEYEMFIDSWRATLGNPNLTREEILNDNAGFVANRYGYSRPTWVPFPGGDVELRPR